MPTESSQLLTETLQKTFRFGSFRPGQLEALTTLMTMGRLLCIQPTGHGKSLLYQLPAVLFDGITLVISPLLALMRDQIAQLNTRFAIPAASFNTDQSDEENFSARQAVLSGKIKILFVAPEQLDHIDRFDFLLKLPISLLVIDEAHCISTWGHDFRPSYRQIIHLVHTVTNKNPDLKLLALTATANDKTEHDIKQQLTIKHEIIVHRSSMDRPNIRLTVIPAKGLTVKLSTLSTLLKKLSGSGLIYCATRENTELVASYLTWHGIQTTAYHAGLETEQKQRIQKEFINDHYTVIAATNALGMGIDKSNLRFVIHFDFPGSITAYYQEVGRCGRDGLPAEGILLYDPADSRIQRHFIEATQPGANDFAIVLDCIKNSDGSYNLAALKRITGLHPTRLTVVLAELIEQQFIRKTSQKGIQVYQSIQKTGQPDLSRYVMQLQVRTTELHAIQNYAEQTRTCLMVLLRHALGDQQTSNCDKCSVCITRQFHVSEDAELLNMTLTWLNKRTTPIVLSRKIKSVSLGMAILDGKLRSPEFIHFMKERMNNEATITTELLQLLKICLQDLATRHRFSCIVPVPSQTWATRNKIVEILSKQLNIPAFNDLLYWDKIPETRQGELLNNDQRQHNVANKMVAKQDAIPIGPVLLLDDYIGSGATLNEAARALRIQFDNEIVPFTVAAVKWHLGKKGMV